MLRMPESSAHAQGPHCLLRQRQDIRQKGAEDMQRKRLVEQAFPQHILRPRRANVLLAQLDSGKELCFSP